MTITPQQLAQNFPEFANATNYPTSLIQFWLDLAYLRLRTRRWGTLLDYGAQLYACHNLVLQFQAARAANKGGAPGIATGPVSSKGVGPVSEGFDATISSQEGWANYNLTTYGTRFAEMANQVGMGPLQL